MNILMNILMCSQAPLQKTFGGSKPLLELAEELERLNWKCKLLCPDDFSKCADPNETHLHYAANLRGYLREHASKYDIVDVDYLYLPYAREEFAQNVLLVARSVLLVHHFKHVQIPAPSTLRHRVRSLLKGSADRSVIMQRIHQAQITLEQADLVNVSNDDDKTELERHGISGAKIVVLPFGISRDRRVLFDAVASKPPVSPVIAFVGTFDYRKGAVEFPLIVQQVLDQVPQARFKMMGCLGMFPTERDILACFPVGVRDRMDIVPRFAPNELPSLLAGCSLGIFPSYIEGFGFGVLEMLAASLPVIAYDTPGPPMMLTRDYLVPRGDYTQLSAKAVELLGDADKLHAARVWAKKQSQQFNWHEIAAQTSDIYQQRLQAKRS